MGNTIECELGLGTTNVNYVAYGTIGWLKTKDNEVRQCKCVGAKVVKAHFQYEWKVAGIKEHQFGSSNRLALGIIYQTERGAQHGDTYHGTADEMKPNRKLSVHTLLKAKYGLSDGCFHMGGTWNNFLTLQTYAVMKDHTCRRLDTDFDIIIDENGVDIVVPMLDGEVNGVRRYPTSEKAYASMKPLKTYSLDDEEDDDEPKPTKKVKVTIEVECDNVGKIKELGTIIEIKNN